MQFNVLIITLLAMGCVSSAFVFAVRNSGVREDDFTSITKPAYRMRTLWFGFLLLVGVGVAAGTLLPSPLTVSNAGEVQVVNAVGGQWYWNLDETEFTSEKPILFKVTSADVNHGFAVYDKDLTLLGQTQAMPGYTNLVELTLSPGEYTVYCLEYCGLAHHGMLAKFTVMDNSQ